jgi:hypothetical protein
MRETMKAIGVAAERGQEVRLVWEARMVVVEVGRPGIGSGASVQTLDLGQLTMMPAQGQDELLAAAVRSCSERELLCRPTSEVLAEIGRIAEVIDGEARQL